MFILKNVSPVDNVPDSYNNVVPYRDRVQSQYEKYVNTA